MDFWWPNVSEDYIFVVAHCDRCCIERAKFVAELSLRLINNPRAFFKAWRINLITNIEPVSSEGYRHCIVTIDCFSKWTEG